MNSFNGLICDTTTLPLLSDAESRSLSAENPTGGKGTGGTLGEGSHAHYARHLGPGWKCSPGKIVEPGETGVFADIEGPGALQSMWAAGQYHPRHNILRIYWDDQELPSVECPVGDFFCNPLAQYFQMNSQMVTVNPGKHGALNCCWPMPFRKRCRMTIENIGDEKMIFFYQINYALGPVPDGAAYFHAQFRRVNPLPYKDVYTIVDGIEGQGHYAGTYMLWGVNNNGWWGEGEIKFYMDGDGDGATIVGTGTEDYFLGCYDFDFEGKYVEFTTPYAGMPQVIRPNGLYSANTRFGMYRWHIPDPVRFKKDLRITIQAMGWRGTGANVTYLPLQDDIASVAFWYQTLPMAPFPAFPDKDFLEII